MKVLQFGFGDPGAHIYLPHLFDRRSVVYTGTHDNDTTLGWWNIGQRKARSGWRTAIWERWRTESIGLLSAPPSTSVAILAVVPVQDVLGLPSDARMNVPSKPAVTGPGDCARVRLTPELANKLALLTEVTDRDAGVKGPSSNDPSHTAMGADFAA